MTRPLLLLLILLIVPCATGAAPASWSGTDASGDATPFAANAWADLTNATFDAQGATIAITQAPAPIDSTAYVLIHQEGDAWRYCGMLVDADTTILYFEGSWDNDLLRPNDGTRMTGSFLAGTPAIVSMPTCTPTPATAHVRAVSLSAAPSNAGLRAILFDELDAELHTAANAPLEATAMTTSAARAVPSPTAAMVALTLAALAIARRWA